MSSNRADYIKSQFSDTAQELRPILTSLNGDNSWLISFPRPHAERESIGKAFFHAVHDPWLTGPTSSFSTYLVFINHAAAPEVKDGAGVEEVAREIEDAAAEAGIIAKNHRQYSTPASKPIVDAIFVNLHGPDHLHAPTLQTFDPSIPVFAAGTADEIIRGLNHFDAVYSNKDLQPGSGDWKLLHPGGPLPEWLTIFRMTGHHMLNFCTAMIWSPSSGKHEALLYSPHGVRVAETTLQTFFNDAVPQVQTLAILHGLKESRAFGWLNTFGVSYGLPLYRASNAKYWVLTHDSPLAYWGLIMLGVREVRRTLEWGLGREAEEDGNATKLKEVNFVDVKNGDSTVLV